MTQKNSLMEWVQQTRRLSKEIDYITADTVDSIILALPLIDEQLILSHKEFFDSISSQFHKPHPVELLRTKKIKKLKFLCDKCSFKTIVNKYVKSSIKRCLRAGELIRGQWWEIIDFMWERPELVNPNIAQDDYIVGKINEACDGNIKNNPVKNGFKNKFGKEWKDENGQWRKERRKRF